MDGYNHYIDGEPISNAVAVNFSGRFKGQEVRELGQAFIRHIVSVRAVGVVFGQQINFRLTSLPENFDLIGGQRAFILYDRKQFQTNDELQYRHFLRDLEMKGRMPKYFLPESNYALCKMKSRSQPDVALIAMSWVTDETNDKLKCINLLRKLLSFTANLCAVEEMPVIIGCSLRLTLDDIKQVVYNEFEGFRCYGYVTDKIKRSQRICDVFISCPPLRLHDVKPIVCGKIEVNTNGKLVDRSWRYAEDVFYWDPVFATMLRRLDTSSMTSLTTSPRALTPTVNTTFELLDDVATNDDVSTTDTNAHKGNIDDDDNNNTSQTDDDDVLWRPIGQVLPSGERKMNDDGVQTAEDALRNLLIESNRIKEMVSEAETRARSWLQVKVSGQPLMLARSLSASGDFVEEQSSSGSSQTQDFVDCQSTADVSRQSVGTDSEVFSLYSAEDGGDCLDRAGAATDFDNEEEAPVLFWQRPPDIMPSKVNSEELAQENQQQQQSTSPLRTVPSYVDLYNQELVETNKRCDMQ